MYTQIVERFVSVGFSPLNPPKLGDFDPEQWLKLLGVSRSSDQIHRQFEPPLSQTIHKLPERLIKLLPIG